MVETLLMTYFQTHSMVIGLRLGLSKHIVMRGGILKAAGTFILSLGSIDC